MDSARQEATIRNYRNLFQTYGDTPEAVQWSEEGQRFRFEKLCKIADLTNRKILDLGCGLGHLYPFLISTFGSIDYTGIDLVPDMIDFAAKKYPSARFECRDVLREGVVGEYDYALISGVFNNNFPGGDHTDFLLQMVTAAFKSCKSGLGFNFISTHVNYADLEMAYHDPVVVLRYCLDHLSKRIIMHHHYERCEVAFFIYR